MQLYSVRRTCTWAQLNFELFGHLLHTLHAFVGKSCHHHGMIIHRIWHTSYSNAVVLIIYWQESKTIVREYFYFAKLRGPKKTH